MGACPTIVDGGWTVNGGGGVASKSAFNLLGGSVEYDIDISNVDHGVNANIYTVSPASFSGSFFNKTLDYCDGAATGSDWCMELDWIESNGHCGGASTIHTIEGPGNDGCTAWGCRVSEHYSNSKFHMKIEHAANGAWTITRDGNVLSGFSPDPSGAWDYIKQMHETCTARASASPTWSLLVPWCKAQCRPNAQVLCRSELLELIFCPSSAGCRQVCWANYCPHFS